MNDTRTPATTTADLVAAGHVTHTTNPFALPRGIKGRLAGWYMGLPDAQHRELLEVISAVDARRILEVGFGPGQVLAMLRRRSPGVQLCGVDPSDVMVTQAARRNPGADLRLGAAAAIPFPEGHADIVLSVNNMPMWPDLAAGLHEVGRVLAPNGTALFAWHGGEDPRGHQRRLVLPPQRLEELDSAIRERFEHARLRRLRRSDLWEASGPR